MLEWLNALTDLVSSSPIAYPVLALLVAADALVPVFPGESSVVAAAVLASQGGLSVWLVALAALVGALAGDLGAYVLGRTAGTRAVDTFSRGDTGRRRVRRARRELHKRGLALIASAQFVPGLRNVAMIAAGSLGFPLRIFLLAEAIGATSWAAFQTSIGYIGGQAFSSSWVALAVSIGAAALIGGAIEGADAVRRRRAGSREDAAAV